MTLLPLLFACQPIEFGGDDDNTNGTETLGSYEMGWPIDACSTSMPDEGEGHQVGEVLPQFHFFAQTGETVALHDFCNRVVYIELGYFT